MAPCFVFFWGFVISYNTDNKIMRIKSSEDFVLYLTRNGLVNISNSVSTSILIELSKKELSLTDLVEKTGKPQSTLSVHLDKMLKSGVIKAADDPKDNRRKTYSLDSVCLARTVPPNPKSFEVAKEIFDDMSKSPQQIGAHMTSFIISAINSIGLSTAPMFEILGRIYSEALKDKMENGQIQDVVSKLSEYYSYTNMGEITVFSHNPLTLVVKSDPCVNRGATESFGMYAKGFFIHALEEIYEMPISVKSEEIFGAEDNYYRFELDFRG